MQNRNVINFLHALLEGYLCHGVVNSNVLSTSGAVINPLGESLSIGVAVLKA